MKGRRRASSFKPGNPLPDFAHALLKLLET
jgi:hypothetical protein